MPLIPTVGSSRRYYRTIVVAMYALLVVGAATMVLPFLFMLSKASATAAGVERLQVVPDYLFSRDRLFVNFLAARYESFEQWAGLYRFGQATSWRDLNLAMPDLSTPVTQAHARAAFDDLNAFSRALAREPERTLWVQIAFGFDGRLNDLGLAYVRARYGGSVDAVSQAYGVSGADTFEALVPGTITQETFRRRVGLPAEHPRIRDYRDFKHQLADQDWETGPLLRVVFLDGIYQEFLRGRFGAIARLNADWATAYADFREILFPDDPPAQPGQAAAWVDFVRHGAPLAFLRLQGDYAPTFRDFLRQKHANDLAACNRGRHLPLASFAAAPTPDRAPLDDPGAKRDWTDFFERGAHSEWLAVASSSREYAGFLRSRYGDVAAVNRAYGTSFACIGEARPPMALYDAWYVSQNRGRLTRHFLFDNYRRVFGFLVTKGNAGVNTVILIFLTFLGTFTVNPLAAYALARFRLPYANRVLLFLLATMAFPAEVAMIPNFLLLKNLGMLNTYAALVLPGLANGMSIFLLKGFFESLPQELYEAASLDGAGEMQMFWHITLPLSTPILAVMALGTFAFAYSSWSWALLLCQDPTMWTIAVELFQFQVAPENPEALKFASFVIASLPMLLVFVFCQKIIMRGIVVPSLK